MKLFFLHCSTSGRAVFPQHPKEKKGRCTIKHHQSSWCKNKPVVCDGNFVGYASGLHFCKCVHSTTAVHVLELYAVMSGNYALSSKSAQSKIVAMQSANISFVPTRTLRSSSRALHCYKENAFKSTCFVLRVEPSLWTMLMAAVESVTVTGSDPLCLDNQTSKNQCHNCLSPIPSHGPDNGATNSASPPLTVCCSLQ